MTTVQQPASSPSQPPAPATRGAEPHIAEPGVHPSFIKGLFLGEIREDLVAPYPELEAEEAEGLRMIIDSLRSFAAASIDSAAMDHEGRFPDEVRHGLHELGLMGLNIPEEYGGFNASAKVFTRVFGEIGATDPALTVYFGAHQSIGCKGITLFGTDAQKAKWLPGCATGEIVAGFCLTEPGSGSDAQAMTTQAVASEDGSYYTLDGTKMWISNAGYAGMFTVFAKVPVTQPDGAVKGRVTAFIVDAKSEGITLGQPEQKMGIKASDTRVVTFEKVRVPAENVIGQVGQGFKIALEILNSGRLGLAAGSAHGARRIMTYALEHAKQRQQFGRPIGSFEMIQNKIARIASRIYAADSAVMLTAGMVDRGGIDFSLETAACKVFASELAVLTANEAMQIAGGIGYSKEYPYEQALRDSRINMIFEGTNEILRALIALSSLQEPAQRLKSVGAAFRDPLHSLGAIGQYVTDRVRRQIRTPAFTRVHPSLQKQADRVSVLVRDLALATEAALMRHEKAIMERQFVQERMADAAIGIYLSVAVLLRTTREIERAGGVERVQPEIECARTFLADTNRYVRRKIRQIGRNQDTRLKSVAERALETLEPAPLPPYDHA